jgi:dTDP-4-amino-4,6-dideoxygalactose transaminase
MTKCIYLTMSQSSQSGVPFVDLSRQHQPLQGALAAAVQATLSQGDFVLGAALADFEANFAAACGVKFAIGMGSGTDAITLGLSACGIGAGDEVILPANTFVATLIGVVRTGATPVLVDCDRATALMDLAAAEQAITSRTRAILPVHLYGQMVAPEALLTLARRHCLVIFEDAAQAHLAERQGHIAGSIGLGAAFSFYPSKNLGALGDGGILVTSEPRVTRRAQSLRNYGATSKYYHTEAAGFNSRLDTLQAAVLNVKLPYLRRWNQTRNQLAQLYDCQLAPLRDYGIVPLRNDTGPGHVYHLYVVRVTPTCPINRSQLQAGLASAAIQTGIHYPCPCHLQPAFRSLGYGPGAFPQTEALSQEVLSLPMFPGLTLEEVEGVVQQMIALVTKAPASLSPVSPLSPLAP